MTNSAGLPTNALFGFTNMLLKLIRDERPDYLAIAWDPKGGSFREREFPEYKGTRPDMPDALRAQMPHFARIAEAFDVLRSNPAAAYQPCPVIECHRFLRDSHLDDDRACC